MKFASFVAVFLLLVNGLFAQSNYQPGLVVKNNGDTVRGFIDHKEWTKNPRSIEFKLTVNENDPTNFHPSQIAFFKAEDQEYLSYQGPVSVDQSSLKSADVPEFKAVVDTVFLQVLTTGEFLTLYEYRDKLKIRFFLASKRQHPEELIYRFFMVERDGRSGMTEVTKFRNQLMTAATDTKTLTDNLRIRIKKCTYSESPLTSIVDLINSKGQSGPKAIKHKKSGPIFYVGAGINQLSVNFDTKSIKNTSAPQPYFNLGFDLLGNKEVGKIAFRLEYSIGFAHMDFKTSALYPDFTSSQINNSLSFQLLYNLYNTQNLKIFLAPGFRFNHAIYNNQNYFVHNGQPGGVPTEFNYVPIFYSATLQAGVLIHKKFEINVTYLPQLGVIVADDVPWTEKFNYLRVGVNYHFSH